MQSPPSALTHLAARPGMGDVLSLVEKAEAAIKEDEAEALTARLLAAKFDFNDFLKQYKMVTGMGSMGSIMKMLPGARPRACPTLPKRVRRRRSVA